jgi:hypothetical protein
MKTRLLLVALTAATAVACKLTGWGAQVFVGADHTTGVTLFTDGYVAASPRFARSLPQ